MATRRENVVVVVVVVVVVTAGVSERVFLVRAAATATSGSRRAVGRRDRNGEWTGACSLFNDDSHGVLRHTATYATASPTTA